MAKNAASNVSNLWQKAVCQCLGSINLSLSDRLIINTADAQQVEFKEGFVCNFLLWWRSRNNMLVEKGKSITVKYYKDVVLKKLEKNQKRHPVTGFKYICPLHDNVPAHTSTIVTAFLKKEKVTVFASPSVFPRYRPMWFLNLLNWNISLLGGNSSSDRHMNLPFISTLLLCQNQRTMTPSGSGYIGWSFALLATGSTSMAWNELFWAYLKFEVSK